MPLTADNQQERLDARLQVFLFDNKKKNCAKLESSETLRQKSFFRKKMIKIKSDPYSDIGKFAKLQTRLDLFPK